MHPYRSSIRLRTAAAVAVWPPGDRRTPPFVSEDRLVGNRAVAIPTVVCWPGDRSRMPLAGSSSIVLTGRKGAAMTGAAPEDAQAGYGVAQMAGTFGADYDELDGALAASFPASDPPARGAPALRA